MTTWADGIDALSTPPPPVDRKTKRWRPWIPRVPIVITGSSGAGKTEIWRQLTGGTAPDAQSRSVDQAYLFPTIRRSRVAITTIPGQISKNRYEDMDFYFDARSRLDGVVFVASYGFDRIWPGDADVVAGNLNGMTIEDLSNRNVALEFESFVETCSRLRQRYTSDKNLPLPWLLVLVNKVDLFWSPPALDKARDYYRPGPGIQSDFDGVVQRLIAAFGTGSGFRYNVLPVAVRPAPYEFASNLGSMSVASQLSRTAAEGSIRLIVRAIGELCDA